MKRKNARKKNILKKKSTTRSTKIKFKIVSKFSKFFFRILRLTGIYIPSFPFIFEVRLTLLKNMYNMYNQFLLPRNSYRICSSCGHSYDKCDVTFLRKCFLQWRPALLFRRRKTGKIFSFFPQFLGILGKCYARNSCLYLLDHKYEEKKIRR